MEQLITPNYNIAYTGGECERFVENTTGQQGVWGAAVHPIPSQGIYTGAWDENYGGGNHPGELSPTGFYVAVYFELGSTPAGHVAIMLPDGRVASSTQSGYHTTAYIHPNLQDLIDIYAKYNDGCTYLGWSEYIGKLQVVKGENMPTISQAEYDDLNTWKAIGLDAQPFKEAVVGSDAWATDMQSSVNNVQPTINTLKAKDISQEQTNTVLEGQIKTLTDQLTNVHQTSIPPIVTPVTVTTPKQNPVLAFFSTILKAITGVK